MRNKSKIILSSLFVSTASLTFLVGCGGNKPQVTGYNVTYHPGTGFKMNGLDEFTSNNINEVAIEPTPDYSSNHRFVGWFNDKELTGEKVTFPLKVSANTNLYAKWVDDYAEGVTVSFDANGGSNVPKYIIKKGNKIEMSPFTSRDHYDFLGWKEKKDGDYITFPYTADHDASLFAEWKQVEFKVKFHTEGSAPESTTRKSGKLIYESNSELSSVETAPTTRLAGSSFMGWFEHETEGDTPVSFPYNVDSEHKDLYARFENGTGKTLTLIDELNDKEEKLTNCLSIPYAPKPIATNSKHKFLGWAKNSKPTESDLIKDYKEFLKLQNDQTLYAVWSQKELAKINYYDDDGKLIKAEEYCKGDTIEEAPKFDKKDYFDFYGWKKEKQGSTYIQFPYTINDTELNLYCDSKRNCFDIKIVDSEEDSKGQHSVLQTISKKSSITGFPPDITIPGREKDYKFDHYYLINDGKQETVQTGASFDLTNVSKYLKDNTLTLYAAWKERTYQILIDYGDGTIDTVKTTKALNYTELPLRDTEKEKVSYWVDEDGNEYGKGKIEKLPLKEMKLTAKMESKFKIVTVHRGGAEDKSYTGVNIIDNLNKESAKYQDIPVETTKHPNYELAGFYIEDPETHKTPKSVKLDQIIENNINEVWEKWEHKTANATIKYFNKNGDLLKTENKEKILTEVKYSSIKTNIDDYSPYSVSVNGGTEILFSDVQDPNLELSKVDNEIKVVMNQEKFTVTYEISYTGTKETHIESHCTEMPTYNPTLPSDLKWDGSWYDSETHEEIKPKTKLTKDISVYGNFIYPEASFTVTFNVGSTQLLAKFVDGKKSKEVQVVNSLGVADFPVAMCEGNKFDGWYDDTGKGFNDYSEPITSSHRPSKNTLYAHWKPVDGYLSMLLKLGEDGKFTESGSDTGLMNIKSGTKWKDVKQYIPENSYQGGEYEVDGWYYIENGKQIDINDETELKKSDFIYAKKKQKLVKPVSFEHDSWATISAVAKNDSTVTGGKYKNGYEALTKIYPSLKIGAKRIVQLNEKESLEVQVVGLGQDYGNSSCTQKLPITFEFVKLFNTSSFNTSASDTTWTNSSLKKKCDKGGEFFNSLPLILQDNISSTYKYVGKNTLVENKLFIPSFYEICCSTSKSYNSNEFQYALYAQYDKAGKLSDLVMKEYLDMGKCSYHIRDGGNSYLKIYKTDKGTLWFRIDDPDTVTRERGINIMFCLGTPYTSSR